MYVITGATGHIGGRIASDLLDKGHEVKVVGRSADRLQPLVNKGGNARVGDMLDADFLTEAFFGATAAFILIPPEYQAEDFRVYQGFVGESVVEALSRSSIEHVVFLSSLGAHLSAGTGPILGLFDQEQRFNKMKDINFVYLRPTYFMENLFSGLELLKHQGIFGTPLKGDVTFPVIATQDIAAVGTQYLMDLDFTGKTVRELLGPKDMSMGEMTRIIGKAIGKPDLQYVQFSYEDAYKAMWQMGLSADLARCFNELNKSINDGVGIMSIPRTARNTTPTTFETFAEIFAAAYNE